MKELRINNTIAVIEDDTYFPFTYTLNDLNEINIINFPSSKSVMLPRNTQNDEIFGNIAEVTRQNMSGLDNKIGVSFNQFKKAQYELSNDGEILSKGIVRIVNITDEEYEIELYDEAIEVLEILEEKKLDELEIIDPLTGLPFSQSITKELTKNMIDTDRGFKPIFGNYDSNFKGTEIFGEKYDTSKPIYSSYEKLTLPESLTPQQMLTYPVGDIPYAVKLNKVFDAIEQSDDEIIGGKISFTNDVRKLTKYTDMLTNRPKTVMVKQDYQPIKTATSSTNPSVNPTTKLIEHNAEQRLQRPNGVDYIIRNGNYYFKNDIKIEFRLLGEKATYLTTSGGTSFLVNNPPIKGTPIGSIYLDSNIIVTDANDNIIDYETLVKTKINLLWAINTSYREIPELGDTTSILTVENSFVLNTNLYPRAPEGGRVRISHKLSNSADGEVNNPYGTLTYPLGKTQGTLVDTSISGEFLLKQLDFTEYDIMKSENVLPKINIQEFIINIAKTYNFAIEIREGVLTIDTKKYIETDDIIIIDGEPDIDVNLVDYSRLVISNNVANVDPVINYNELEDNVWCSKVINTGYNIRKTKEEVEMPYSTTLPMYDYQYFGYDAFGNYYNGGYNRSVTGDMKGLEDELTLGFVNYNLDEIYLSETINLGGKKVLGNYYLREEVKENEESIWRFISNPLTTNYNLKVHRYPTFLPYRMNGGVIVETMEFNKPRYNFAGLTDYSYPENSTFYNRYHKRMLEDKYNADTHILTAKLLLEGKPNVFKVFNYKNSNYIISELTEYDPTEPGLYEVKLMRVNDVLNYTTPPPTPPEPSPIYIPEIPDEPELPTVSRIKNIPTIYVPAGTASVRDVLPSKVEVILSNTTTDYIDVVWDNGTPTYNGNQSGNYIFKGTLINTDYQNPNNLKAELTINVMVEVVNVNITSVLPKPTVDINYSTDVNDIQYPPNVSVGLENNTTVTLSVIWDKNSAGYNPYISNEYTFSGELVLPNGIINTNNLKAEFTVFVKPEEISFRDYNNQFQWIVNTYVMGDARMKLNSLQGYESKLLRSVDGGAFTTYSNNSPSLPVVTYSGGQTKISKTFNTNQIWNETFTYKVKSEQQLKYTNNNENKSFMIPDGSVISLDSGSNISTVAMTDTTPRDITIGEMPTPIYTLPIYLNNFKKVGLITRPNKYELEVSIDITNGTTELNNSSIEFDMIIVNHPTLLAQPVVLTESEIDYLIINISGGIRITLFLTVLHPMPDLTTTIDGFTITIPSNPSKVNLEPRYGKGSVSGSLLNPIVASQLGSPKVELTNIQGNSVGFGVHILRVVKTEVLYSNNTTII